MTRSGAPGPGPRGHPSRALVALALAVLLAPPVAAHRLKEALTTVEVNARTGLVEVIHRFWLHDAEHAIGRLGGLDGDIRRDRDLQQAFARYVAARFLLADAAREPLELELLGVELDGPYVWVYQEMAAEHFAEIAYVAHGALQEIWRDQLNQVNVKRPSGTRSLRLRAGDTLVALPPPEAAPAP